MSILTKTKTYNNLSIPNTIQKLALAKPKTDCATGMSHMNERSSSRKH